MKLTARMLKDYAAEIGVGGIGIANIERFANAPRMMHPSNIFPDCKSVISIVQPIPRGTYRGITEGTHWANYTYYAYNRLNTLFRPRRTYDLCCFIEDRGFEAVPVFPAVPERAGNHQPVAEGRPPHDVNLNVRIAGVACGLGEIGWSKVFLHHKFGPRVRLGTILTDAELEPDPLIPQGTLCRRCYRCVGECPGAIPKPKDREPIRIQIADQTYEWGDVDMGQCTLTHHGLNWEVSPFMRQDLPGLDMRVRDSIVSEETAYRLCYSLALAKWIPGKEAPGDSVMPYYNQIISHTGYFALCGARGCIRGCMKAMEKQGAIEQCHFKTPVSPRKAWKLDPPETDSPGGIAEGRYPEDYNHPDPAPGSWT